MLLRYKAYVLLNKLRSGERLSFVFRVTNRMFPDYLSGDKLVCTVPSFPEWHRVIGATQGDLLDCAWPTPGIEPTDGIYFDFPRQGAIVNRILQSIDRMFPGYRFGDSLVCGVPSDLAWHDAAQFWPDSTDNPETGNYSQLDCTTEIPE